VHAAGLTRDLGQQQAGRLAAHLLDRLADGGQRRLGVAGHRRVLEADHGHVLGDPAAGSPQGPQRPGGHQVVGGHLPGHPATPW
jgi:hypothetical protein